MTVILATAGLTLAITPILNKVLESVTKRPVLVTKKTLKPVEDSNGKVVVDKDGNPQLYWSEIEEFEEPTAPKHERETVELKGPLKLELKFTKETKH